MKADECVETFGVYVDMSRFGWCLDAGLVVARWLCLGDDKVGLDRRSLRSCCLPREFEKALGRFKRSGVNRTYMVVLPVLGPCSSNNAHVFV